MKKENILEHKTIVIMGTGRAFLLYQEYLKKTFQFAYITDNDPSIIFRLPENKYAFITPDSLTKIEDPFVIVATTFSEYMALDRQLKAINIPHCFINSIVGIYEASDFPVVHLASLQGVYTDHLGNVIELGQNVQFPMDTYVHFGRRVENLGVPSLKACNNHLSIGSGTQLTSINGKSSIQLIGNNSSVKIGNRNIIKRMRLNIGGNSSFSTGDDCTIESINVTTEGGNVEIGEDCMFSHDIELWQTDTHPFFDMETGRRLNSKRNIKIGKHVWLALNVTLLGGANIGSGSIVGAKAVTSGKFPENVVVAGNPARVVREKIQWCRDELVLNPEIEHISDCPSLLNNIA